MDTKVCNVCNVEKLTTDFYKRKESNDGLRNECKSCTKVRINNYRRKNKKKVNNWNKETYYRNIEKHKETNKKYRDNNKEKEKVRGKNYRDNNTDKIKKYYEENKKELLDKGLQRIKKRYKSDELFKIKHIMRARLSMFLKLHNITKKNKTFDIIGCLPTELKGHLEKQFTEGMCWERIGKEIHIDHIIPLSSAKNEDEVYKLCHYTNLQPLWAEDNLRKRNKII
jgi:hypothetical protein